MTEIKKSPLPRPSIKVVDQFDPLIVRAQASFPDITRRIMTLGGSK
jgi:hypothetical protein